MKTLGKLAKLLLAINVAAASAAAAGRTAPDRIYWVSSWGAAQQIPEPDNALSANDLSDATLREVVHLSLGGTRLCLHLSNAFGTAPLHLDAVHLAQAASAGDSAILPGTDREVMFGGQAEVTIPAGAEYWSDPIALNAAAFSNLAISIHYDQAPGRQTGHPGSRATSYVVHGNEVAAQEMHGAKTVDHWYQIAEVDVSEGTAGSAVVAFGDSITDGHGSAVNANERWPDVLARRLAANPGTKNVGVVNAGIGGGRVLLEGLGPNALARFDRDVLGRAGAKYVLLLEGVNDLGVLTRDAEKTAAEHQALVQQLISAYEQIILRAHNRGIKVFGATITPYTGSVYYHPGAASEQDRQQLNTWIRTPGHFDGVVDFDKVLRDPQHPERLNPSLDSGDHLHPSAAGYRAMGDAVPLQMFEGSQRSSR